MTGRLDWHADPRTSARVAGYVRVRSFWTTLPSPSNRRHGLVRVLWDSSSWHLRLCMPMCVMLRRRKSTGQHIRIQRRRFRRRGLLDDPGTSPTTPEKSQERAGTTRRRRRRGDQLLSRSSWSGIVRAIHFNIKALSKQYISPKSLYKAIHFK